jgi:hypothetical protein
LAGYDPHSNGFAVPSSSHETLSGAYIEHHQRQYPDVLQYSAHPHDYPAVGGGGGNGGSSGGGHTARSSHQFVTYSPTSPSPSDDDGIVVSPNASFIDHYSAVSELN